MDRRAAAVLAGDAAGYLAVFAARPELQAQQAAEFAALAALGPSVFRYDLLDAQPTAGAADATEASVQARLNYRIAASTALMPWWLRRWRWCWIPGDGGWRATSPRTA